MMVCHSVMVYDAVLCRLMLYDVVSCRVYCIVLYGTVFRIIIMFHFISSSTANRFKRLRR